MIFTEEQDQRIVELYQNENYMRGAVAKQAKEWGCRSSDLHHRMLKLRSTMQDGRPLRSCWLHEEMKVLETCNHKTHKEAQQLLKKAGYQRSVEAIKSFRYRLGWTARCERDEIATGFSANQLAGLLHVHTATVVRWIKKGYLKATEEGGIKQPRAFRVMPKDLKTFLIKNIHLWEPGNVDKYWLMDILK